MGSPRRLARGTTWRRRCSKVRFIGVLRVNCTFTFRSDPDDNLPNGYRLSNLEHFPEINRHGGIPPFLWVLDRHP